MRLFEEIKRLSQISEEAFDVYANAMSYLEKNGKDILMICSTKKNADCFFDELAKNYLSERIFKSSRKIKMTNKDSSIYVVPVSHLRSFLPGHRFKNIYFIE